MSEDADRIVAALLADWGKADDPDPAWTRTAERVVAVLDAIRPATPAAPAPDSDGTELEALLTALKTKPADNAERARMSQAAIDRITELRDLAVKAVWATRTGNPSATDLARYLHMPPGVVNVIVHTERR